MTYYPHPLTFAIEHAVLMAFQYALTLTPKMLVAHLRLPRHTHAQVAIILRRLVFEGVLSRPRHGVYTLRPEQLSQAYLRLDARRRGADALMKRLWPEAAE